MLIRNHEANYIILHDFPYCDGKYVAGEIFHNYINYTYGTTNINEAFHFSTIKDAETWLKRNTTWAKDTYKIVKEDELFETITNSF